MAAKKEKISSKKKVKEDDVWPKVEKSSHFTITRHENGKVDMVFDWDQLEKEVAETIKSYQDRRDAERRAPKTETKPKAKRKAKKSESKK